MRKAVGIALLGLALVFLVFELVALIDPVGTKMADDSDPFGSPAPWYDHALTFGIIAVLTAISARLLRARRRRGDSERAGLDR